MDIPFYPENVLNPKINCKKPKPFKNRYFSYVIATLTDLETLTSSGSACAVLVLDSAC